MLLALESKCWRSAQSIVLAYYAFLGKLDDRDQHFLDLAKYLLHKPYPKTSEEIIKDIKHPLAWLMEGLSLSDEAASMNQEDIGIYLPNSSGNIP
ncbi:MAG: hypothetical protein MAG431_01415 [Chloroflexi bacterium]|nr:hypothetical protein [Chloroflexota bacterium]